MNRNFFELSLLEVIDLDLKLKLTKYDRKWNHIGNHLFSFYNLNEYDCRPSNKLVVNNEQYNFLKLLSQKNYEQIVNKDFNNSKK